MGQIQEADFVRVLGILEGELDLDAWWYMPADEEHLAASTPDELTDGLGVLVRLRWALWGGAALYDFLVHDGELPRMVREGYPLVAELGPADLFEAAPLVIRMRERLQLPREAWPGPPDEETDQLQRQIAVLILEPLFHEVADLIRMRRRQGDTATAEMGTRVWTLVAEQLCPNLELEPSMAGTNTTIRL